MRSHHIWFDLLHVLVLRRNLLELLLQVLEVDLLGRQLVLQLLVVVPHARQLQLELLADLVHLHPLLGLQVDALLLELVAQLTLGVACNDHCLLVAAHLRFQQLFEVRVFLEQSLYFLLEFLVVEHPLVLLPSFLLEVSFQLTLLVAPLLLFFPEFLLHLFPHVSLLLPLGLSLLALVLPLALQVLEGLEVFLFE